MQFYGILTKRSSYGGSLFLINDTAPDPFANDAIHFQKQEIGRMELMALVKDRQGGFPVFLFDEPLCGCTCVHYIGAQRSRSSRINSTSSQKKRPPGEEAVKLFTF